MKSFKALFVISVVAVSLLISQVANPSQRASALSGSDFNASRIIDDSIFFNSSTMSPNDIQAFLNAKVPSCRSGYTCLKDYVQTYGNTSADSFCGGLGGGTKSAAQIIYEVAKECGVNPQSILVTLQKEQSLITDTWPEPTQYRSATGYGCPDTAACDSQYYGFFNQVYRFARQVKRYVAQPGQYNYAAGRTSYIGYQVASVSGCGGTNLTLQNGATAALYNYTPYQPNPAALNNLYGQGDRCSAYGNRNFWRLFNDWFGPTNGDLVRSVDNATIYLISGDKKYPISDQSVLSDFSKLGPIRFVSNEMLNSKTTGSILGHMVGAPNGTLYFVNAGIKLAFTSCDMVAQYGYSCSNVIQLTEGQLSAFWTGPYITQYYRTTSGKLFYIANGQKREVFDDQSLAQQSLGGAANTLLEEGLNYLPHGVPIIRNGVVAASRSTGLQYYYENSRYLALGNDYTYSSSFLPLPHNYFDEASIPGNQRVSNFSGFIKNNASSAFYVITPTGKAALTTPSNWPVTFTTMSDNFISGSPSNSTGSINNNLLKSVTDSTVYNLSEGKKRPIPGWNDLLSLNVQPLVINELSPSSVNSLQTGALMYGAGSLVKTANSSTVYVVKNANTLYPITSFIFPQELGLNSPLRIMSDGDFQTYTVQGTNLTSKVICDSKTYVGSNGVLREVPANLLAEYGFAQNQFTDVGSDLCRTMTKDSRPLDRFIGVSNGTIYYVTGGQKRGFTSYAAYVNNGGTGANTSGVSDYLASLIPTGSHITN